MVFMLMILEGVIAALYFIGKEDVQFGIFLGFGELPENISAQFLYTDFF